MPQVVKFICAQYYSMLRAGAELREYNEKILLTGYKVSIMVDEFQYNKVTLANLSVMNRKIKIMEYM